MSPSNEIPDLDLPARAADDSARADPLLEALVGRPREETRTRSAGADAVKLVNLVDSAVVNSSPTAMYVDAPKSAKLKKPRRHRRIDWVNTVAASAAVVVVAATAVFTGVQMASADPSADAVEVLAADEEVLAAAENSVATSATRLEESIVTGLSDSALIRTALTELAASDERRETADPAALATAVQAVDGYRAALEQAVVPPAPAPYERGNVDEKSLASVADAINEVQGASTAVDEVSDAIRTARTAVDNLNTTYANQLTTFATSLTAYAAAENEAHPVAGQELRDAVTAAAATANATPLSGASGAAALTAFRDAVVALREDDLRVRELEQRERERSQNNQRPVTPAPVPDPVEPEPEPEPAPTDPATEPGTDPLGGGGLVDG
ncbi:hypothetical protein [Microbacterium murale]|uniref:Uncharacterized protein n=1 Tax=Microbacterium murale TaxID=1081040 RepID=A0ABU0PB39_9MICO|nr:hypothetical protein [Microbacterium murale]MDQ0644568.1 hypothetical protein [Microbacterium murale]